MLVRVDLLLAAQTLQGGRNPAFSVILLLWNDNAGSALLCKLQLSFVSSRSSTVSIFNGGFPVLFCLD